MKTVNEIRNTFLKFFEDKGHEIVASSSLVPQNDPTLMFTNAGMNQFKDVFTGKETRPYNRATTSQKCVRAGGKHNDLENVGYTARHHTFFEMLGNFSFGDYFKEDAIAFAWELVTKEFQLPADKLCVTVHSSDEEAAEIWKKVTGFADHKIIRIPTDDNFWRMGDTGPCGPCTEIFFDHGEHIWGGPPGSPEEDGDRFIEIWNNVFMQYEQIDADTRIDLPAQSVDTGMGLERIAATLGGSHDNYTIDIMRSLIEHSADLTGIEADGDMAASHKVIADHIRASSFLMADGVMPSNEGRGYVLRRIMRRGMRHAHLLGAQDPLMYKLFPTLLGKMGEAFPELKHAESLIVSTLEMEEKRFKTTLDRGLKILDEEKGKVASGKQFPGDIAFKLYDTYGFPLDLTQDALRSDGIEVDVAGFDLCMFHQREQARKAWRGSGDTDIEKTWFDLLDELEATEFLGYEIEESEGKICAIVESNGELTEEAKKGDQVSILTNQTPFYGESGGQVGDTGVIIGSEGEFEVSETQKRLGSLIVHVGKVTKGNLKKNDSVQMKLDKNRRTSIRSNHSVTHLMHEALRKVLGDHVTQKGSLQDDQRTRFDISHPKGVSKEEIAKVEEIVNEEIKADTEVVTLPSVPLEEAREMGAMALFGEKYGDEVRVVKMGRTEGNQVFSIELCGGTHVKKTGEIEKFKITSESALSSGVRRLEAKTGARVDEYMQEKQQKQEDRIKKLKADIVIKENELKALGEENLVEWKNDDEDNLVYHLKSLQKQISKLQLKKGVQISDDEIQDIGSFKFVGKVYEDRKPKDLKPMADDLKAKLGSGVIVLISTDGGKASIVVGVTEDLTERFSAVDLVRIGSQALGGKGGGGRPDMAQAGGPDASAANDAVSAIEKALAG